MRSRKILLGLACLAAGTLSFAETAHADRRSGLGGNLLIQDPDDLFPFPQYAVQHRNMIRLDYGATLDLDENRGNGVLTFGNKTNAFGLALHRGDLLNPDVVGYNTELAWLGGVGNPFGATSVSGFPGPDLVLPPSGDVPATATTLPATVVDLFYGHAKADRAYGVRFGYGRGVQAIHTDGADSRGSSSFFVGQFGFSMLPPEGLRLDISGNLMAAFGRATDTDDTLNKGFDLRIGTLSRGYYALNQFVDFAFLAAFSADNEHSTSIAADVKSNDFSSTLMAGIGPAVHTERAQLAAYGGFSMGVGKNVPDTDDNDADVSRLNFLAPMVNMAVEVQILDWLYVRTGAQYIWQIDRYKGTDADGTRRERISGAPFTWAVGLGVAKNNFYFDGVLQNGFVTNGPNFIGGGNGFLAMASMTYKFGDVFDGASFKHGGRTTPSTPPQERVAPVLVPPPALPPPAPIEPAPEPLPEAAAPALEGNATGTAHATSSDVNAQGSASADVSIGR